MNDLRVLVVDDKPNWQETLPRILGSIGGKVQVDVAPSYEVAVRYAKTRWYDLAILDLNLLGDPPSSAHSDQLGMDLLGILRASNASRTPGMIVLTGYPSTDRVKQALRDHGAYDFLVKAEFEPQGFIKTARAAIFDARQRQATALGERRYILNLTFSQDRLLSAELRGPDRRAIYTAHRARSFATTQLARVADNLNLLILEGGPHSWRPKAFSLGQQIYQALIKNQSVSDSLSAARALAAHSNDLWIEFCGPAIGLGVPFELAHLGDDYLALSHVVTRRLSQVGSSLSRKPETFHRFVSTTARDETLRVLVVGANSDDSIPQVTVEAQRLTEAFEEDLRILGIPFETTLLLGPDATYERVTGALRNGRNHIFHYAGHGRFDDRLPEISGLILRDGHSTRTLTASDLNMLVRNTDLRLVFLSCCLGARSALQVQRGDFLGVFDALVRADVPSVLGYRWTVRDDPARELALNFYKALWRTFSLGDAVLEARTGAIMEEQGRNDETWASPIIVVQNV